MPIWNYRCIYHMTEASNWPSIQRSGLLSTSRLLDLAGLSGAERYAIERHQRLRSQLLPNGATIRDQRPIPPAALARCLTGDMKPEDWYAELNRRVFFWLDPKRLNRQRRASRRSPQIVLVIDADCLLSRYASAATLTAFNTGNARRKPARRGRQTFVPYARWRESGWVSEAAALETSCRPLSHAPVELAIPGAIEDILETVVLVRRLEVDEYLSL
jgi:hypothetical protein